MIWRVLVQHAKEQEQAARHDAQLAAVKAEREARLASVKAEVRGRVPKAGRCALFVARGVA